MLNKIIGFTVSINKIEHEFDFMKKSLNSIHFNKNGLNFFFWGIGDIKKAIINNKYTLSYPITESLDKRNVLIYDIGGKTVVENDWLSSVPVFYNKKERVISTLFNACVRSREINKRGFNNFLSVGYSTFGETPLKEVNFLRYNSRIILDPESFEINYKEDVFNELNSITRVDEVNEIIRNRLKTNINNHKVILPLSGGYDSKYLASIYPKKDKLVTYTYGLTENPKNSFETILAQKVAKELKLKNSVIKLGNFSNYIDQWHSIFGCSTHLHGMYQIDFYNNLVKHEKNNEDKVLLSGIVGDAWAGSIEFKNLNTNINDLFYSHGMNVDGINLIYEKNDFFYYKDCKKLQIIELIRAKMILLSYLLTIPEYFGIVSYSPFLDKQVVLKILNLPEELRYKREWQKMYFNNNNLEFKTSVFKKRNLLNINSAINENYLKIENDFEGVLNKQILDEVDDLIIKKKFNHLDILMSKLYSFPYTGFVLRKFGIKPKIIRSYFNYLVIKAIDKSL